MNENIVELGKIFYRATMDALGYDYSMNYGAVPPPVRLVNQTYGAPDWNITDDVTFISITPDSDEYGREIHEAWEDIGGEDLQKKHWASRTISVTLTGYGPNGYNNLATIRHAFLDGSKILRSASIFIIPSADAPRYAPELYQSTWWERADLVLRFYTLMKWDETVKSINEVPVTIITNASGSSTTTKEENFDITKKG